MSYSAASRKRSNVSDDTAFATLAGGRLKRGSLDILPSLSLDILCEIFCFMHPADLLVLARTSKAFRCFLLRRSAAFIWRSARRNVYGLPEPPSDMNEVQYASLVFGLACHYKGCDRKARDTVWHLRIRSCASCRQRHQPIKVNESDDCLAVCAMLACYPDALEQYIPCGPFLNSKGNPVKGFQESHIKTFKDELGALPIPERQAYLNSRRQAAEIISQFASAGVGWQLNVKTRILLMSLTESAKVWSQPALEKKLIILGGTASASIPFISSTQAMTDKGIHPASGQYIGLTFYQARSTVLDQLREYMLGWRELRMEEQVYAFRRQVFVDAWLQFTITAFYNAPSDCPYLPLPPSATIGFFESIDSVIRQSSSTSHESLLERLHAAFLPACEYILEWQRTTRRELASLLPNYKAEDDDETIHAQLKLATSIFYCNAGRNCPSEGRTLAYPEILFHPCFTFVTPGNGPSPKDPRGIANQKACLMMGGSPWNCNGRVQVHPRQSTTAAEMDKQDPRFACLECAVRDRVIAFISWRRAVEHSNTFHPNPTLNHPWFMASSTSRAQIDRWESPNLRRFSSVSGDTLGDYSVCLLCPPRIPSWNTRFGFGDLVNHIKNKCVFLWVLLVPCLTHILVRHGVPSPIFGKDYVFDMNITPVYLDPVMIR
ncbi:hypothetical protein J3R82DRAFT_5737 [Butyriboletus roseoflavus]|nr:hypothetical protein J3R82DRAFT_5737 [Butyriboletus roseoflavus]